ncbi:MAG: putative rane spanning protein [Burkholderiales bacterium]|nr:putative rane spanning protein [Burkholderiales bacterium]
MLNRLNKIDNIYKNRILIAIPVLFLIIFLFARISQPLSYHNFFDQRTVFGIPNFLNVLSNVAFIISGIFGLYECLKYGPKQSVFTTAVEKNLYLAFFFNSILVGFGSGYYHLNPNNPSLMWDRLPMSTIIVIFLSILLIERVSKKAGLWLLLPLLLIGITSVLYWEYSELIGQGDLRFYIFAQACPIVLIVAMLLLYKSLYSHAYLLYIALAFFVFGKLCELLDYQVYKVTQYLISGHTSKHLLIALAIYYIAKYISSRRILN